MAPTTSVTYELAPPAVSTAGAMGPIENASWFGSIIVQSVNLANTTALFICTDGNAITATPSAAAPGADTTQTHVQGVSLNPSLPVVFLNEQALPNNNLSSTGMAKYSTGVDGTSSQSESVGWAVQQGYVNAGGFTSGFGTYVSLWVVGNGSSNMTGDIVITLQ